MGFQHLSKEKRKQAAKKSVQARRSLPLQKAWDIEKQLRDEFKKGKKPSEIAEENNISFRAVYRIVRGK